MDQPPISVAAGAGFDLTVAEALWKKKPVVASAVGGIPAQAIHKHMGCWRTPRVGVRIGFSAYATARHRNHSLHDRLPLPRHVAAAKQSLSFPGTEGTPCDRAAATCLKSESEVHHYFRLHFHGNAIKKGGLIDPPPDRIQGRFHQQRVAAERGQILDLAVGADHGPQFDITVDVTSSGERRVNRLDLLQN